MSRSRTIAGGVVLYLALCFQGFAQQFQLPTNDVPPNFQPSAIPSDFEQRIAMIPMRDGTKLYTVVVVPKGAK